MGELISCLAGCPTHSRRVECVGDITYPNRRFGFTKAHLSTYPIFVFAIDLFPTLRQMVLQLP
jgi:hypothetical protein